MANLESDQLVKYEKLWGRNMLLNVTSLARLLGVGRTTVYEWLYAEQLPPAAKIINKRRYWTAGQIENFLQGKKNE
jgi:predicted DNA-binding transcriptional regulator AlpA